MLTGRTPFEQHPFAAVASNEAPKPASAFNSAISEVVDLVLCKALSRPQASRYASCTEFAENLAMALATEQRSSR
jgi:hypothetical protein